MIYRHLPLPFHPAAEGAARASICAERQGRFREMYDRLFGTEAWLSDTNWNREAESAGVPDLGRFGNCLHDIDTDRRLAVDRNLAEALAVAGTPTFVHRKGIFVGILSREAHPRVLDLKW